MKFLRDLIAPVLAAVLTAGAAQGALYQWSKTAASNATADPTINWSEGMSPGTVNDSARAMMARVAEWRDDSSGSLTTGGTASAYTLTTNQGLPSTPTTGQMIGFTVHANNNASATLQVDGGTAFPLQHPPATAIRATTLLAGASYTASFNGTAWILRNFYNDFRLVPLGAVLDYSGTTSPGFQYALANGQCISRTTYANYFNLVGTTFGACDGATTFAVPDLSNRVVAGTQMGGTARITVAGGNFDGNTLGASGGSQNHTLTTAQLPAITPAGSISQITPAGSISQITPAGSISQITPAGSVTGAPSFTDTRTWNTVATVISVGGGGLAATSAGASWQAQQSSVTVGSGTASAGLGTLGFSGTPVTPTFSGTSVTPTFTGNAVTPTFAGTSFGSGSSHPIVPPTVVLTKIVRVL